MASLGDKELSVKSVLRQLLLPLGLVKYSSIQKEVPEQ